MADEGNARHDDKIERLLQEAEQQMRAGQLTKPLGDNAYETYRQVLRLDPENAVAKAGVAKIVSHYEEQAQQRRDEPATKVMQAIPHASVAPPAPQTTRQERPKSNPPSKGNSPDSGKGNSPAWRMALYASMVLLFMGVGFYLFWRFAA